MLKKLLFIYNPNAGKSKIKGFLSDIIELFTNADYEITIHATRGKKDGTTIVEERLRRENYDLLVCSGGDGTLNEIIAGVLNSGKKVAIGYLPSGTTNDFSVNLNIPKNLINAAKVALRREEFPCDIGSFNGNYFTYTAAFGLFTDASYETPQATKNILGRMAYILEGIKRLPHWKSYSMDIHIGDRIISDDFIYGMITNSESVGGIKGLVSKEVILDDGFFEGIFIKTPQNVLDLQYIINDLLTGKLESDYIYSFSVYKVKIVMKGPTPWSLDGEFGGEVEEANIEIMKQAVTIIHNTEQE